MADAYARLTGKPAIALVTGGPGHANAVSALYTAAMAESPVVLLSGHAPNAQLGMGAFQEMRQADIAAPLVKAAWTATSAAQVADEFARAVRTEASVARISPRAATVSGEFSCASRMASSNERGRAPPSATLVDPAPRGQDQ